MKIIPNPAYPAATILKLSAREFEVFRSIACGQTAAETAAKLGLADKTVNTYRERVKDKLGLKNNQQIAVLAFKEGITVIHEEQTSSGSETEQVLGEAGPIEQEPAETGGGDTQGSSPTIGEDTGETA